MFIVCVIFFFIVVFKVYLFIDYLPFYPFCFFDDLFISSQN